MDTAAEAKRQRPEGAIPSGLRQAEPTRCWLCDGLGAVAVADSYYGRRTARVVDVPPRLEVCYACLGTGVAR